MRSSFDITDILFKDLLTQGFPLSGDVYKQLRPVNSELEDIVVNSLPVNAEQLQQAVLNVNIFVPNLKVSVNNLVDTFQPDWVRLKSLTSLVLEFLKSQSGSDYWYQVQQQNFFADQISNSYYSNIRVNFYSENL
jgi:hypothetical protein